MMSAPTKTAEALTPSPLPLGVVQTPPDGAKILEPTPLTSGTELLDSKVFGGKAASLRRLYLRGLKVPMAWAIPCDVSVAPPGHMPLIQFPGEIFEDGALFSVRSGAPVSMPGMLATRLNVPPGEVPKAIIDVILSWNSAHARAYRKENKISDNLGTGVIIQSMPSGGVKYAGTAFTAAPGSYVTRYDFDPTIEVVVGLGEGLVSGEDSGVKLSPEHLGKDYKPFLKQLEQIHADLGPSDVEWCYSNKGNLYFLQWRPQKFALPAAVEGDKGRDVVAMGRPLGSNHVIIGRVKAAGTKVLPGDIVMVEAFRPEYYSTMMSAAAIITANGGETCHAAIVGRTHGKPALSGVTEAELSEWIASGKPLRLNGATGYITVPLASDVSDKVSHKMAQTDPQLPNLNIRGYNWDAALLLCRFYRAMDMQSKGELSTEALEDLTAEIAGIFAAYQYIICSTECRYASKRINLSSDSTEEKEKRKLHKTIKSLGIPLPAIGFGGEGREKFAMAIHQPKDLESTITAMRAVSRLFRLCWLGKTSYGGAKWADITDHLVRYLSGEIPNVLYVDGNFNLEHNGGLYFNKFPWMIAGDIMPLLNARQKGFKQLRAVASELMEVDLVTKPSLKDLIPAISFAAPAPVVAEEEVEAKEAEEIKSSHETCEGCDNCIICGECICDEE
jgi:pyruvate,orthophosphate dikinase